MARATHPDQSEGRVPEPVHDVPGFRKIRDALGLGSSDEDWDTLAFSIRARQDLLERLYERGQAMAAAIEDRWSGPGGCDCRVCSAAKAWREIQ